MRVTVAISTLLAAISLGFYGQSTIEAAAVTAGAPEHLVAGGGECVRLFHSKGDVGCRSASSKDMAPVFPIESKDELSKWLEGEKAEDKVVLVLPESLVTADNLKDMGDRIAGLIAYADLKNNVTFASTTPQGNGSPDAKLNPFSSEKVKWNPDGLGLIDTSVSYPIFLLNATYAETFLDRARMNKKKVAGATFTAFMNHYYGPEGMNSIKCLAFKNVYGRRNPKCDPIGGQSSWGIRGDRSANETIVVMTGMDAYAYSQVLVPGANEGASGLAALLGAAQALQAIPDSEFNKQIIFAAFQAEKFGFVGSRRFLSDIKKAKKEGKSFCKTSVKDSKSPFASEFCTSPLHPTLEFTSVDTSSITYAIAVDQVGILGKSGNFSIHVNPKAEAEGASALVDAITSAPSAKNKFSKSSSSEALPPTPLLSFVNKGEFGQEDLVGAVIAGYDTSFNGKGVYGSRHDIFENIDVDAIVQASQVLAETVYQLGSKKASDSSLKKIKVDKDTVHSIVRCISMDWRCDFMKNYTKPFVNTLIEYLDLFENAWPVSRSPVSLYSGPMDSDRQPLVIEDATADVTKYLTDFNGTWSDDVNRVNLFPNAYEMFTRSFLAATLGDESATKKDKTCTKSQECEDKALECVHPGVCVKRRAYFHDAYSPGLVRTASVQLYDVVDENMPLWTEPSWSSDVGTYVFPNPGNTVGWIALVVGIVVTALGGVVSRWLLAGVQKMKLL